MPIYGHAKVSRNVQISHCYGQSICYGINGELQHEDFEIDIYGCYTPERATRFARRVKGDKTITIYNVEIETQYHTMDIQTFLEHSERIYDVN